MKNIIKVAMLSFIVIFLPISAECVTIGTRCPVPENSTKKYEHQLNSPDVNIFWKAKRAQDKLVISGLVQNNYYAEIFDVDLYVRIYNKKGQAIKTVHHYFINLESGQMLPFVAEFSTAQEAKNIQFLFDYNYAEWGYSVDNYGLFTAKIQSRE